MKKTLFAALLTILLSAALVFLGPISKSPVFTAHAQDGCTNSTLAGNYGFSFNGFQIPHGGSRSVPFVGAGRATLDIAGNVTAIFADSVDGLITPSEIYSGSFLINSDCTGSLTATSNTPGDNFAIVVVGEGKEILGSDISNGETLTIDFKKQ
jgi:hypothetical protein